VNLIFVKSGQMRLATKLPTKSLGSSKSPLKLKSDLQT